MRFSELFILETGWPLVMEIMEIMEKSWNFFYKDYPFFFIIAMLLKSLFVV